MGVNTFDSGWEIGGALADPAFPFSRTTWIDANALTKEPLAVDGNTYELFRQEAGTTANGAPISYLKAPIRKGRTAQERFALP